MSKQQKRTIFKILPEKSQIINGIEYVIGQKIMKKNGSNFGKSDKFVVTIVNFCKRCSSGRLGIKITGGHFTTELENIKPFSQTDFDKLSKIRETTSSLDPVTNFNKDWRFSCMTDYTTNPKFKQKYPTKEYTIKVLQQMMAKYPEKQFVFYLCDHCNSYHIGKDITTEIEEMINKDYFPLVGLA